MKPASPQDEDYERFKRGELLQPKGRRSLVHGGVGPALLLSQEVLGVKGVGAGFEECRIEVPQLRTVTWARGVFPSVRGDIHVEWRHENGNLTLDVQLPSNLAATLVLPPSAGSVIYNGRAMRERTVRVTGGTHRLEAKL